MSSFLKDVRDEIKAIVIATIPTAEATTSNVIMSIAAARDNLFEAKEAGKRTLPIWIIDAATAAQDDDWGVDSNSYRCPVRITELRKADETDAQITIQDHLVAIHEAMYAVAAGASYQVIERGEVDTGPDEATMGPIIDLGLNFLAGSLYFDPGVLCGTNL